MNLDQRERDELCDLMLAFGPDAPTLCEGWANADLAAHLVVRENDPRSAPGILIERFAGYTERLQDGAKAKGFERNVARLRSGPPMFPWRVPMLRELLNLNEWFVHHEDVRRANGMKRRDDRPDLDDALWAITKKMVKLTGSKLGDFGLVLVRADGTRHVARDRAQLAELRGEPSEIALYLVGRRGAAASTANPPPDRSSSGPAAPRRTASSLTARDIPNNGGLTASPRSEVIWA